MSTARKITKTTAKTMTKKAEPKKDSGSASRLIYCTFPLYSTTNFTPIFILSFISLPFFLFQFPPFHRPKTVYQQVREFLSKLEAEESRLGLTASKRFSPRVRRFLRRHDNPMTTRRPNGSHRNTSLHRPDDSPRNTSTHPIDSSPDNTTVTPPFPGETLKNITSMTNNRTLRQSSEDEKEAEREEEEGEAEEEDGRKDEFDPEIIKWLRIQKYVPFATLPFQRNLNYTRHREKVGWKRTMQYYFRRWQNICNFFCIYLLSNQSNKFI